MVQSKVYDPFDKTQAFGSEDFDGELSRTAQARRGRTEQSRTYDSIVLGAGAAGMAASIYFSRYNLSHVIVGEVPGGQFLDAVVVENYPGFASISGPDLVEAFRKHVESYGVKIQPDRIGEIKKEESAGRRIFIARSERGETFAAKTLLLALGARHRPLNIPGEDAFLGRGVSYCATCDAPLFKGKVVAVVGGGDSAVTAVIHLASFAEKVYLVHRRGEYTAVPAEVARLRSLKNVVEILNNTVKEIQGKDVVEEIVLANPINYQQSPPKACSRGASCSRGALALGEASGGDPPRAETISNLPVDGVFVEVGLIPASSIAKALGVGMDENGYITVNVRMETNVAGVFAAGDLALVTGAPPFRQIITSAADGARAAAAVYQYLRQQVPPPDWG